MPNPHLPYIAVSGLLPDRALVAISERRNIDAYIASEALEPHHLRLLASMPSTTRSVLRQAAKCSRTDPAGAVDFSASASTAKILLQASKDATVFKLYNQYQFKYGHDLHDNRKGADRFRNTSNVFAVLCERILHSGDVLPAHVLFWYNDTGRRLLVNYIDSRGADRSEMRKCYRVYRVQKTAATIGEGVVNTTPYEFMRAYQHPEMREEGGGEEGKRAKMNGKDGGGQSFGFGRLRCKEARPPYFLTSGESPAPLVPRSPPSLTSPEPVAFSFPFPLFSPLVPVAA